MITLMLSLEENIAKLRKMYYYEYYYNKQIYYIGC